MSHAPHPALRRLWAGAAALGRTGRRLEHGGDALERLTRDALAAAGLDLLLRPLPEALLAAGDGSPALARELRRVAAPGSARRPPRPSPAASPPPPVPELSAKGRRERLEAVLARFGGREPGETTAGARPVSPTRPPMPVRPGTATPAPATLEPAPSDTARRAAPAAAGSGPRSPRGRKAMPGGRKTRLRAPSPASARSWMAARIEAAGGGAAAVVGGGSAAGSPHEHEAETAAEVAVLLARSEPAAARGRGSLPASAGAASVASPSELPEMPSPPSPSSSPVAAEPRRAAPALPPALLAARLENALRRLDGRPPSSPPFPGGPPAAPPRPEGLRGLAALGETLGPQGLAAAEPTTPADPAAASSAAGIPAGPARREGSRLPEPLPEPLPGPLWEAGGNTDLAGQLDRLLRRQARRHGIDLETP